MCVGCEHCGCGCDVCVPVVVERVMPVVEFEARARAAKYREGLPVEVRSFVLVRWEDFL